MTAFAMQDAWKLLPVPRFPYRTSPSGSFGSKVAANAFAYGALSRVPAVIGIEGAEGVSAG